MSSFVALDLGTTTLAGRLFDNSGRCLAENQVSNPQAVFGTDVLRRLEAAKTGQGKALQAALVLGINELVSTLRDQSKIESESIKAVTAAANPAISTLLRNDSPDSILAPPYRPENCSAVRLDPEELGLDIPVPLYLLPLVNGFVGGDLVAFLFGQNKPDTRSLYIDIGTNGEIALFADGQWRVTSVAAGPAFEGGNIDSGMLYGPGAIRGVAVEGDRLNFDVVNDLAPRGLCGSGLADLIAVALESGLIDRQGSIVAPERVTSNLCRYVKPYEDGFMLEVYRDAATTIVLTQNDVRNFQLAKAAVRAGIECLLQKTGIAAEVIGQVVLTGAFGFSLSENALKNVAILPENMVDKVRFEPDGVLAGLQRMLMLENGSKQVEAFAKNLAPLPLSGTPVFEKAFLSAIDF